MKILKLVLRNFKGIKYLVIDFKGNMDIYGDNGAGKTTIFDAVCWLLFGKDSADKKKFDIKTLVNGEPVHKLEHEVEAVFDVNGNKMVLKKVFHEKWTKKRGQAIEEFSGHTTDHYVDEVPVSEKEYIENASNICDESVFKLLTNPLYFSEKLHWEEARKLLLQVCGDLTDEEVINSNPDLAKLSSLLNGKDIDKLKKIIASKRSKINAELKNIPIRISEVQRGIPDISLIDFEGIERKISELEEQQQLKRDSISGIRNGSDIAEKNKRIAEIDSKLITLKAEQEESQRVALTDLNNQANDLQIYLQRKDMEIESRLSKKVSLEHEVKANEKEIQALRDKWNKVNGEQLEPPEQETVCPTCGQDIHEEQIQVAIDKAIASFNLKKSEELANISSKGKDLKTKNDWIIDDLKILSEDIEELKSEKEKIHAEFDKTNKHIEDTKSNFEDITENYEYKSLLEEKKKLQEYILDIKAGAKEQIETIESEIRELNTLINALKSELAKKQQVETANNRIKELEDEERKLAKEFEELEEQLYLTEEFTKQKVNMLEEKINSKFEFTQFKLFETQVNGGLNDCCEATLDGRPFKTSLSNGEKLRVGVDIINTLSDYYNFYPPIFVDNAESVTKLPETKAQLIRLVVSEADKKLRMEAV